MILNYVFGTIINVHDKYNHNKTFIVLFGFSEIYIYIIYMSFRVD